MTEPRLIPDWVKVKIAAVFGVGTPWLGSSADHLNPILDILLKLGQVGVVTFTVLYTYSMWRNSRKNNKK